MAIVVVDEAEGGIVILRGKSEGVFGEEVTVGDAGGAGSTGDGAEGGVVVVGGDAVLEGVVEYLGDVLVAVVGVEEGRVAMDAVGASRNFGLDGIAIGDIRTLNNNFWASSFPHLNSIFLCLFP